MRCYTWILKDDELAQAREAALGAYVRGRGGNVVPARVVRARHRGQQHARRAGGADRRARPGRDARAREADSVRHRESAAGALGAERVHRRAAAVAAEGTDARPDRRRHDWLGDREARRIVRHARDRAAAAAGVRHDRPRRARLRQGPARRVPRAVPRARHLRAADAGNAFDDGRPRSSRSCRKARSWSTSAAPRSSTPTR